MPKQGDAVCLAAGQSHPKLRAGRRYTVRRVNSMFGGGTSIRLADAATGEAIDAFFWPSSLAPATEAECLALHAALYLGGEAGVVRALLEAYGEVHLGVGARVWV